VVGGVQLEEPLFENAQAFTVRLGNRAPLADCGHLPQDERGGRLHRSAENQKVGRLIGLKPPDPRVDPEVGKQAVRGRDRGKHGRGEPFPSGSSHGLVAEVREDAGMAVENGTDASTLTHRCEDRLDDLVVDLGANPSRRVVRMERPRTRVQRFHPDA